MDIDLQMCTMGRGCVMVYPLEFINIPFLILDDLSVAFGHARA
jgi:hypothetical protein